MKTAALLGTQAAPASADIEAVLQHAAGRRDSREVEEHIASLPAHYLDSTAPEEVLWHMDVLGGLTPPAALDVSSSDGTDRVVVVGTDRTGFLGMVASAFALHGVSVRSARLFTRADGSALDIFDVADDRTGGRVPADRWARVTSDLTSALSGDRDLAADVAARAQAYRAAVRANVPVVVRFPETTGSPRATTIEVRCADRVGRLAEIVAALYAAGLTVVFAKLDTRAGEVVDTFSVRRNGHPVNDEAVRQKLAEAVCAALR